MTPATIDISHLDTGIRAEVVRQLSASGLSEQAFVNYVYRGLVEGKFTLLDVLGPNVPTLEAMQELADGFGSSFETVDDLFADLHADD